MVFVMRMIHYGRNAPGRLVIFEGDKRKELSMFLERSLRSKKLDDATREGGNKVRVVPVNLFRYLLELLQGFFLLAR